MKQLRYAIRGAQSEHRRRRPVAWLLAVGVLAMGVLVVDVPPSAADGDGITFAAAQDYPSATITYNGTASPGVITHLYRNGRVDKYADLVLANIVASRSCCTEWAAKVLEAPRAQELRYRRLGRSGRRFQR